MKHMYWQARMDDEDEPDAPEAAEKDGGSGSNVLENRLLRDRKVMVFGQITDKLAKDVVSRLLTLAEESDKPIDVYVNSPGGHVESGDSIHDAIKFLNDDIPIRMIGTGWVASAGALIFVAGKPKQRICLPHTRFLLHQPMGGIQGKAVDIDIEAREILKMRDRLNRLIADETGQTLERVSRDTERNYWMTAAEAIEYGLCSRVIAKRSELESV